MTGTETVAVGVEELLAQAKRLGLVPGYRIGTVLANSSLANIMVTLDNDTAPSRCFNFTGPVAAGQRVLTLAVPPHGLYAIGRVSMASLPTTETFTVTGTATWTRPSGLLYVDVQVQAAGGSGGGAAATIASQWAFGDGGGGGEYARGILMAAQLGATETVTVGQGGIGSTGSGTVGGNSSFGSLITCVGGGNGSVRPATTTLNFSQSTQSRNGGSGGTGGTIRVAGSPGGMGVGIAATPTGVRAGDGGQSFLAGGFVESLNGTGSPGRTYGGGGPGVANSASQAAVAAKAGGDGTVIITSYFA